MIKQSDPGARYQAHKQAIDAAIQRVLSSGWYILGNEVQRFEAEFSDYIGSQFAIGVASGTDALELALRALDIGTGDTVITVSMTAVATVAAIGRTGAEPRFVDIDPIRMTLSPTALAEFLERQPPPLPKAIIPVHLYGQPADMANIKTVADQHGIPIIEDCAQAHGASIGSRRTGTWGNMGCFSMYPTKNLGAFGDAGAVVGNDPACLEQLKLLRQYGWRERSISAIPGVNSRLDELQAAILHTLLPSLDADNQRRRKIARLYDQLLHNSSLTLPPHIEGCHPVYHQYVVRSPRRDPLLHTLRQQDIHCALHYPAAVHQQPAYQQAARLSPALPHTEAATASVLSLPIYPELPLAHAEQVGNALAALAP